MRVIDLDTGDTLQAANDEDLVKVVVNWMKEHEQGLGEDEARELVERRAYDATDS